MKLVSAQGHFGTMNGQVIRFDDGLNVLKLPNEGGKTTLSHFICVMLYGLNTSRRDSRTQLADKNRFRPADGSPMSGLLEVEHRGRRIVISRQTGKGGPMQEFSAWDADTGEPCGDLTSRDCGQTLTGVGEEAFRSSAMIDGTDQAVSAKELSDRILALSTTGDHAMRYSQAAAQLDKWRNALVGAANGQQGRLEREIDRIRRELRRLDELEQAIGDSEAQRKQAQRDCERCETAYRREYERQVQQGQYAVQQVREQAERLRKQLPEGNKLERAEQSADRYRERLTAVRAAEAASDDILNNYQAYRDEIDRAQQQYEHSAWGGADIHVRWWALALAAVCGVLAACSVLPVLPSHGVSQPLAFSLAATVFVVLAFWGSARTLDHPPMDFERERRKLEKKLDRADGVPQRMLDKLQDAEDQLVLDAAAAGIEADEPQAMLEEIARLGQLRDRYLLCREQLVQWNQDGGGRSQEDGRQRLERAERELAAANSRRDQLMQQIASLRGRCEEVGGRSQLVRRMRELEEQRDDVVWRAEAIGIAKQALVRVNTQLTGRMAPQINRLAQGYLARLTGGRYTSLQLYTNFEAVCRQEGSAVELDRLRLSTGTRDQLYLALRLAACAVLLDSGGETVPVVLDDPFLAYDDQRTQLAMGLLEEIAQERQVILLTGRAV